MHHQLTNSAKKLVLVARGEASSFPHWDMPEDGGWICTGRPRATFHNCLDASNLFPAGEHVFNSIVAVLCVQGSILNTRDLGEPTVPHRPHARCFTFKCGWPVKNTALLALLRLHRSRYSKRNDVFSANNAKSQKCLLWRRDRSKKKKKKTAFINPPGGVAMRGNLEVDLRAQESFLTHYPVLGEYKFNGNSLLPSDRNHSLRFTNFTTP